MCLKFPITTIYPFADQCFDALIMEEFTALEVDAKLKPTLARLHPFPDNSWPPPPPAGPAAINRRTEEKTVGGPRMGMMMKKGAQRSF